MTVLTPPTKAHAYTKDGRPYPSQRELDEAGLYWRDLRPSWMRDEPDPILGEQNALEKTVEEWKAREAEAEGDRAW
jgi:hypothetical protein